MKNILLSLCLVIGASCASTSTGYNPDNIRDSVNLVCDRHDTYVNADASLADAAKQVMLGESLRARTLLELNPVPAAALKVSLGPVLVRYHAYVSQDTSLTAPQMQTRLRTADLLQRLLDQSPN